MLLAGSRFVQAQNKGANPYLDSEHAYQVPIGKTENDKRWVVTDDVSNTYTITTSNEGTYDWFDIDPAATNGGNEQVTIYFDRAVFSVGTWYLRYYEDELQSDGLSVCISAREYSLNVSANTFHLDIGADKTVCNAESGEVHTEAEVDNDPVDSDLFPTSVSYTVTMNKGADYSPDNFSFDAVFDVGVSIFDASVTTVDGGAASWEESGGIYTVTVIPGSGGDDPFLNEVEVTLDVTYNLPVLDTHIPELSVSNGQAVKDGTPQSITYDNETVYPVSEPGDREQIITINELPATADIGPGDGETASSASNPLQNSTHNYLVTMEDQVNHTGTWSVENDGGTVMTQGTDYSITETNTGNDVTAAITFTENMPIGTYTIKFEEENTTSGCSTVRAYDVNLGEPLNVSVALADAADAERCPDVSGTVVTNSDLSNATTTIIEYTVTLNTTGYGSAWSFDMGITSDVVFATTDVDVAASGINVTGGTFSAGADNYSGSVSVAAGVTEVTIAVTYEGFYVNEHNLTVSLTNIEGSFNDAADDVNVSNIINAMPQPLALEGVDQ